MKCPECNGTGEHVLLTSRKKCDACDGTGWRRLKMGDVEIVYLVNGSKFTLLGGGIYSMEVDHVAAPRAFIFGGRQRRGMNHEMPRLQRHRRDRTAGEPEEV